MGGGGWVGILRLLAGIAKVRCVQQKLDAGTDKAGGGEGAAEDDGKVVEGVGANDGVCA